MVIVEHVTRAHEALNEARGSAMRLMGESILDFFEDDALAEIAQDPQLAEMLKLAGYEIVLEAEEEEVVVESTKAFRKSQRKAAVMAHALGPMYSGVPAKIAKWGHEAHAEGLRAHKMQHNDKVSPEKKVDAHEHAREAHLHAAHHLKAGGHSEPASLHVRAAGYHETQANALKKTHHISYAVGEAMAEADRTSLRDLVQKANDHSSKASDYRGHKVAAHMHALAGTKLQQAGHKHLSAQHFGMMNRHMKQLEVDSDKKLAVGEEFDWHQAFDKASAGAAGNPPAELRAVSGRAKNASATARSSGDHAEAARLHKRAMDVATKKGDKKIADWHEKAWKGHVRAAHWTKKHEDCGMTLPDLADLRLEMLSVLAVDEGMAEEASEYIASALAKKKSQVREQETGSKYPREVKDASMLAHKASMDSKEPHAGPDTHARASNLHFIAHGIAKAHQFHDLADRHMQMAQKHRTLQKPAAVSNAG